MNLKTNSSNLKLFTESFIIILNDKQKRVICQYIDKKKLKTVMKWKERLKKRKITISQISEDVGIKVTRLSEYINFKRQPHDKKFEIIEKAINKRGA